ILGGPSDIAYENGMDDFARIDHVPVAVADIDKGHGGTYWEPNGGAAAEVVVDWLDWHLRADANASRRFLGADCGLCTDAEWTFEAKGFAAFEAARSFEPGSVFKECRNCPEMVVLPAGAFLMGSPADEPS